MKLTSDYNKLKYVMLDVCTIQSALTKHEYLILLNNSHEYFKGTVEDMSFRILKCAHINVCRMLALSIEGLAKVYPKEYILTPENMKICILCSFFQSELTDILSNLRGL